MQRFDMRVEFQREQYHAIGEAEGTEDLARAVGDAMALEIAKRMSPKAVDALRVAEKSKEFRGLIETIEAMHGKMSRAEKVKIAIKMGIPEEMIAIEPDDKKADKK